jgi:hypothetical protein
MAALVALLYSSACRRPAAPGGQTLVKPAAAVQPVRHRAPAYRVDNGLGSPIV